MSIDDVWLVGFSVWEGPTYSTNLAPYEYGAATLNVA